VQDLVLTARVVRYRRERWLTPEGETIVAPLPGGIRGHFGPELSRFVLMQYHQGQVTVERLVTQLQVFGISISKREVMRLLIDRQDDFLTENRGCCGRAWRRQIGSRWTTPARGIAAPALSARRSATTVSPGLAPPAARAG
jgi:hypothetical protein